MYAGLFLLPWVLLYGVTAFLFNHPDAFAPRSAQDRPQIVDVPPSLVFGTESSPQALAKRIATAARVGAPLGPPATSQIVFMVERNGKPTLAFYDSRAGRLVLEAPPVARNLDVRNVMLQLHKTSGYSSSLDARSGWAMFVDAMFLFMLYWATSGILMWWQVKNLRWVGGIVLSTSVAIAAILIIRLYHSYLQRLTGG